jgi:hypothetical protein
VLLCYALALPGSVHLNRGNHEDRLLCQVRKHKPERKHMWLLTAV